MALKPSGGRDWLWTIWLALAAPFVLFLLGPPVGLTIAGGNVLGKLLEPESIQAMVLSLWTTAVCTLCAVLFGTPLALLLARGRIPLRGVIEALIDLPVVLPPAVAGIALLLVFGRQGPVGGWLEGHGVSIAFTSTAVVLAQLFVASPLYVRAAIAAFASLPAEVEQNARLDGASPGRAFWRVSLPLVRRPLLAGAGLCWARALGEFGATILFAGAMPGRTQTMPLAIYIGFETDLDAAISLSVVLLALALVVTWAIRAAMRGA
ncbi:MAG: molybdate ABC transporter permease subunit [Fimbriimonas ginsengisoli]|uniref:Molybdenum transport system permease n=1 Tax=Fimbriimonas ginsengisoli TaxID=1005039 RepID=A0A931LVW4_FIMGI|nr:molybdate ABC transporter permease subunit [Fimbriimonas ginsengisoli]